MRAITAAILLIALLDCTASSTVAEEAQEATGGYAFPAEALRADFLQLRKTLEENPSIMYQFTAKESFDGLFDRQYERITGPMAIEEFRRIIAPAVAGVGCVHTSLWMPPGYWSRAEAKLIPLRLVFLRGNCYVWRRCRQSDPIIEGSQIVAIEGVPIDEILAAVKANVSADGFNESFRNFKMNEGFAYRYALEFGFRDSFEFDYRLPGETALKRAVLMAVDQAAGEECSIGKNSTEGNALDYTLGFEMLKDSTTAVITSRSFAFYDRPETFTGFIDSVFAVIHERGIRNLILDIRNNDGGNPFCSSHLLSYLEPRPLPYFAEEYGRYAELARPVPRAAKPFTGRLFTLINGNNISTTSHFCSILKYHKIGTFIGMETGGTYACNAATKDVHLDNTGCIVSVSTKTFAAAVKGFSRTRGIEPDVTVVSTIEDLLQRRNAQKEYALRLIDSLAAADSGCTVVMATRDGVVLVGNNEDRNHPQTILSFAPASGTYHGRVIFGYDDSPVQGGMNDQGLFIDGNALAPTGWQPDPNKPTLPGSIMMYVLATCATCEDVKAVFEKYNVRALAGARFPVADRSGHSMVIEYGQGRVQFVTSGTWYQIATNFVMSNVKEGPYPCRRYRAADTILSESKELNPELIRRVLDETHQEGNALTVYSNIYDLTNGIIHIYNLRNFDEVVVMNLVEELARGARRIELPALFKSGRR